MLKIVCDRCTNEIPVNNLTNTIPKGWTRVTVQDHYDGNHPPNAAITRDLCATCSKLHSDWMNPPVAAWAPKKTLDTPQTTE